MEKELANYSAGRPILSKDHRVVQAIAMKAKTDGKGAGFKYPEAADKTWPQFWDFLKSVQP